MYKLTIKYNIIKSIKSYFLWIVMKYLNITSNLDILSNLRNIKIKYKTLERPKL